MTRWVFAALLALGCGGPAQQTAAPVPPKPAEGAPAVAAAPPESPEVTITSKSPDAIAHLKEGRQLVENQRAAEATEHLQKALELDPDFALATAYLARVTPGAEGIRLAERSVELAKPLPEPERKYIESSAAMRRGERAKAVALLREVAAAKPRDARVQAELSAQAFVDENWDEAIAAGKKALELDPKNIQALNYVAYAQAWAGHTDDAIATAKQPVALAPDEPNPHDTLGEILLAAGRLDEALAEFQTAVAKSEKFTLALVTIGQIKMMKGDWKGGYDALKRAHDTGPRLGDKMEAGYFEGWALAAQGKSSETFKIYDAMDKAAEAAKNDAARAFLTTNRAVMLALVGKGAEARKQAAAALAKGTEGGLPQPIAHNVRFEAHVARVFADWKLKDRADIDKAYAALEDEAKSGEIPAFTRSALQLAKGLVAWTKGNPKAAVAELAKCSPLDELCRYIIVGAYHAAGDRIGESEARALFKASPRRSGAYLYGWTNLK
jgi:tetratricopeptide (TPR) repeat protein